MKLRDVTQSALQLLAGAALVSAPVLEACAAEIVAARPLRDAKQETLSPEEWRQLKDADKVIERLTALEADQLEPDAMGRWGELLAASKGLTMAYVGPVAHAFRVDRSAVSTIMGPYGSAKTTTCFQKIINSLLWQPKGPDGVRRARWCVVRDTYGHLEANVMADWFMWFPKTPQNWNASTLTHRLTFALPIDGKVEWFELEMLFRAVGDQSAEELFKGMQLTGLWLNEKDTLDQQVFKFGFPRVGRYRVPGTPAGGWSGVIGDMNAPAEDNWTYDFNVNKNIGLTDAEMAQMRAEYGDNFRVSFHVQPGGMDPGAENLANLPRGYYQRIQIGMSEPEQRRFIHNKFGAVRDGNPVYSQYSDDRHCIANMAADPRLPVHLGLDGGNTPAAVFGQKTAGGQIRVVDECVVFAPGKEKTLASLGAKEFGQLVGRYWNDHFAQCTLGEVSWADPSAWYGDSDANAEDRAWIHRFVDGFNETAIGAKIKVKPAPVKRNLLGPRLEAVRDVLKGANDNQAAYVISDRCKVLREGYNRGYVVVRSQLSTGGGRWGETPVKNDFSHVHDANQYLVLGLTKFEGWEAKQRSGQQRARDMARRPQVNFGNGHFAPRARG